MYALTSGFTRCRAETTATPQTVKMPAPLRSFFSLLLATYVLVGLTAIY